MWVDLSDGRVLGVPVAWFARLFSASREQREEVRLSARGLHWESLDEDISVAGLLEDLGDQRGVGVRSRRRARMAVPLETQIPFGNDEKAG
jgi:hypothetical protein